MMDVINNEMVHIILKGIALGVASVFLGWVKSSKPGKLEWRGFVLKIPVGIAVGIAASYKGLSFEDAMVWASGIGIVGTLDHIIKALVRRLAPGWLGISKHEKIAREGAPEPVYQRTKSGRMVKPKDYAEVGGEYNTLDLLK